MFLGTTFFGGRHTFMSPPIDIKNFKSLSISDGTYDHLFLSINPDTKLENINDEWTYETKLNAKFDRDLEGGSVGFSTKNTDTIVIQTREKGELIWKTIFVIPINSNEDFNFIKNYFYSRNLSLNEYKLISQINGIENSSVIVECKTEFDGFFIVDKENVYGTVFNINITDTTQNTNNTTIELYGNKYPSVYTYSDTNYISGTTSGCFIKYNMETCQVDKEGGVKYRENIMKWLCNDKSKILKLEDGRIFLIKVVGKPSDTNDGHIDLRRISFDWVEIGDINNTKELYINNLSDVPQAYW